MRVGSGRGLELERRVVEPHSLGRDDTETVEKSGLSGIRLGDATQADKAMGWGE